MISEQLHSNQEVAAFMSLMRMNMLAKGHKFESWLRRGRIETIHYGVKELKQRDLESRTAEIPEIAFFEASVRTDSKNVFLAETRELLLRILDRIPCSAFGRSSFKVVVSAGFTNEYPSIYILMTGGQGISDGNNGVRRQVMSICMVSARKELAGEIMKAVPTLGIEEEAEIERKGLLNGDFFSKYYKEQEMMAVCNVDKRSGLNEELEKVLDFAEKMGMICENFISVAFVTPLMSMTEENRTLFDGTIVELSQDELDQYAEEYRRDTELLDPLGDDFLAIGGDYPWKFALSFMSEGAFYGYEWERKGSLFQDMRYKHPVGRLKVKGGGTHKFILHWDGECYRIEITDMEPDSELGKEMASYGISFETITTPKKKK